MIFRVEMFTDEKGRVVTVRTEHGDIALPRSMYRGEGMLNTNMGPVPFSFDFPEGYSLEKCFIDYESIGRLEVEKIMAEQKSKIITPAQAGLI